ncbi:prenylated rab acceptor PRA1 [Auriculariales sp. MPI-PUGE-AT-0066]|nr:prenylated rab acceptor PRA1 [Auriculariales sp. MPI-PUGE-AT-0066]
MEYAFKASEAVRSFREQRLSTLRPITEFFDYNRISRPADLNTMTTRISYNTRYFSGNYIIVVLGLAVYTILMKPELIFAVLFLVGGFVAINKYAPEATTVGDHVITQKSLYTVLFVIGIPLLWWASPFATMFYIIGSSLFIVIIHASLIEPGVESEYAEVEGQV